MLVCFTSIFLTYVFTRVDFSISTFFSFYKVWGVCVCVPGHACTCMHMYVMRVYVLYVWMYVHVEGKAGCLPWLSLSTLLCKAWYPVECGAHELGSTGWPISFCLCSPMRCLQTFAAMPAMFLTQVFGIQIQVSLQQMCYWPRHLHQQHPPLYSLLSQFQGSSFSQIVTLLVTRLLHAFELHFWAELPLLQAAESWFPLHCIVPAFLMHTWKWPWKQI